MTYNRVDVDAGRPIAESRAALEYAFRLHEQRRMELDEQARREGAAVAGARYAGPSFEVHLHGDLSVLFADAVARNGLEALARTGGRNGVVILLHGDKGEVLRSLAGQAPRAFIAAVMVGKSVRFVDPPPE